MNRDLTVHALDTIDFSDCLLDFILVPDALYLAAKINISISDIDFKLSFIASDIPFG
jgi:hypothetical protein